MSTEGGMWQKVIFVFLVTLHLLLPLCSSRSRIPRSVDFESCEFDALNTYNEDCAGGLQNVLLCNPGELKIRDCIGQNGGSQRCQPCPQKYYQSHYNKCTACRLCSDCGPNERIVTYCSDEADTVCEMIERPGPDPLTTPTPTPTPTTTPTTRPTTEASTTQPSTTPVFPNTTSVIDAPISPTTQPAVEPPLEGTNTTVRGPIPAQIYVYDSDRRSRLIALIIGWVLVVLLLVCFGKKLKERCCYFSKKLKEGCCYFRKKLKERTHNSQPVSIVEIEMASVQREDIDTQGPMVTSPEDDVEPQESRLQSLLHSVPHSLRRLLPSSERSRVVEDPLGKADNSWKSLDKEETQKDPVSRSGQNAEEHEEGRHVKEKVHGRPPETHSTSPSRAKEANNFQGQSAEKVPGFYQVDVHRPPGTGASSLAGGTGCEVGESPFPDELPQSLSSHGSVTHGGDTVTDAPTCQESLNNHQEDTSVQGQLLSSRINPSSVNPIAHGIAGEESVPASPSGLENGRGKPPPGSQHNDDEDDEGSSDDRPNQNLGKVAQEVRTLKNSGVKDEEVQGRLDDPGAERPKPGYGNQDVARWKESGKQNGVNLARPEDTSKPPLQKNPHTTHPEKAGDVPSLQQVTGAGSGDPDVSKRDPLASAPGRLLGGAAPRPHGETSIKQKTVLGSLKRKLMRGSEQKNHKKQGETNDEETSLLSRADQIVTEKCLEYVADCIKLATIEKLCRELGLSETATENNKYELRQQYSGTEFAFKMLMKIVGVQGQKFTYRKLLVALRACKNTQVADDIISRFQLE